MRARLTRRVPCSIGSLMPVNSTHPDHDENLDAWLRIRDVLAGDRAIKRAGEKYVARLDSQTDEEFRAYVERCHLLSPAKRISRSSGRMHQLLQRVFLKFCFS